jgi:hypothetical protein
MNHAAAPVPCPGLPAPDSRDLGIARLLGGYWIPFKSALKVFAVDYLALYLPGRFNRSERNPGGIEPQGQTGSFGNECAQIQYEAEAKGHELTTHLELLHDEPDHSRAYERNYKIQIGGLEIMPRSVKAEEWRRTNYLYTTGEYLLNAKTVKDLVVHSEERQSLRRSLRASGQRRAISDGPSRIGRGLAGFALVVRHQEIQSRLSR